MKISLVSIPCVIIVILLSEIDANPDECTYVFLHKPVCGNDGVTYLNSGHLTCEKLKKPGLLLLREGECPVGGSIVEDGPLGDRGDDNSNKHKIKLHIGKKSKKRKLQKEIAKQIIKNIKNHKSPSKRHRGRRSAEENYHFNDYLEEYAEYPYESYEYLEDALEESAEPDRKK